MTAAVPRDQTTTTEAGHRIAIPGLGVTRLAAILAAAIDTFDSNRLSAQIGRSAAAALNRHCYRPPVRGASTNARQSCGPADAKSAR